MLEALIDVALAVAHVSMHISAYPGWAWVPVVCYVALAILDLGKCRLLRRWWKSRKRRYRTAR